MKTKELEENIRKILRDDPGLMESLSPMKRRFVQEHVLKKGSEKAGCGV